MSILARIVNQAKGTDRVNLQVISLRQSISLEPTKELNEENFPIFQAQMPHTPFKKISNAATNIQEKSYTWTCFLLLTPWSTLTILKGCNQSYNSF